MKKVITQTASHLNNYRALFTTAILGVCVITAFFYAYNLYNLISHTVAIEHTQSRAAAVSSNINDLDAKYLKLSSNITPDVLAKYGLLPGVVSIYITREPALGNLARGGHEL